MTKSHGRKSRARKTSRRQGAGFAAAIAGTLHDHQSGPSITDLRPADPGRWGAQSVPDLRAAAALIGACIEDCAPCRRSLSGKVLDADPVVLAVTAGAVFALHASRGADAQDFAARPGELFFLLVEGARAAGDDFRILPATVERMPVADRVQLLDEALDLWASYGRQYPGLIRGGNLARALRWSHTPALPLHDRGGSAPGRAEPRQPNKEDQFPMSERTDDITVNAENAARSFAELVAALQREEIMHPVQAQRVDALLTRSARELKAVLALLRACVEELQEQGLLMTDYRGEPLARVLHRYTEASAAAEELAEQLGQATDAPVEGPAHREGPIADYFLAVLTADLQQQGIGYPLEAYRIYSYLTRCAGEMRTVLAQLKAFAQKAGNEDAVQRYAASSFTAVQLAAALGTAYSASGHLAYNEDPGRRA